jgi:hypothetical protein
MMVVVVVVVVVVWSGTDPREAKQESGREIRCRYKCIA